MEYKEFYTACDSLKEFINAQAKLCDVMKIISPASTGGCEFGNKFIDDYITVVGIALNDNANWFSWFVFENEFGKNEMKIIVNKEEYIISDEKQFFDICIQLYNTI